jgi:predicted transcriptional regulator
VRVELRLAPDVARRLFAVAAHTGRTVSAVGESALSQALPQERAM